MAEFQRTLNFLAETSGLDAQAAANVWAGTTGLDLVGALNAKAGTVGLELNGVCKVLAGQEGGNPALDGPGALGVLVPNQGNGPESLDPSLWYATGLWRATSVAGDWEAADGWVNEGTAGSALDLTVASEAATLAFTNATTEPGDGNRVTPELVDGAFVIGLGDGDPPTTTDNVGADYSFFSEAAFDASGSFAFWYLARQGSPFGQDGWHVEEANSSGGFISYVGDAASFSFTPPFNVGGAGVNTETMIAGRQQFTFVVDRATDTYRCYRNGEALTVEIPDIDDMGDATAALPLVVGPNMTLHNIAYHLDEAAETLDVAAVHTAFGAL
jgi:hypothetical protein